LSLASADRRHIEIRGHSTALTIHTIKSARDLPLESAAGTMLPHTVAGTASPAR
jgi:hypothetical protein